MSAVAKTSVKGKRYRNSRAMLAAGMPAGAFAYFVTSTRPDVRQVSGMFIACPGCREMISIRFQAFKENPIVPRHPHRPGNGWSWDGDRDRPTVNPSIQHIDRKCGWHGWLRCGEFVST